MSFAEDKRSSYDVLYEHAIPLLQARVVILRLQALRQTQQDEVEHLLHLLIRLNGVRKAADVVLRLRHVVVLLFVLPIDTIQGPWRVPIWPWVVESERGEVWDAHDNVQSRDVMVVQEYQCTRLVWVRREGERMQMW